MAERRSNVAKITILPNIVKGIIKGYDLTEFTEQDILDVVSEHLKLLCEQNIIEKDNDQTYKLTEKGNELLKSSTEKD